MRMQLVPTLPGLHFISSPFLSLFFFLPPSCPHSAQSSPSAAVTGLGLYSWIQSERFRGSLSRRGEAAVSATSTVMSRSRRLIELKAPFFFFSCVCMRTDAYLCSRHHSQSYCSRHRAVRSLSMLVWHWDEPKKIGPMDLTVKE